MRNFLKKLKSEKGATGTDVIVSATMIVITISIVSMLYVNISIQSRNITRTAGATRIATNLIENIDAMSYADFVKVFDGVTDNTLEYENTEERPFSTKIPNGYKATIEATPVYGSHGLSDKQDEQFDLVRQVNITVEYKVGNKLENVQFSTVKQRELIAECNSPSTSDLRSDVLSSGVNFYPVKYLQNAKAYVRTTEDDPEWYNYTNKNWATVVVSKKSEKDLFDLNGKLIAKISTTKTSDDYTQKVVWIPKYFTSTEADNPKVKFAFYSSANRGIEEQTLKSNGTASFLYNTAAEVDSTWKDTFGGSNITGKWVLVNSDNSFSDASNVAANLNKSQYGPCNMQ